MKNYSVRAYIHDKPLFTTSLTAKKSGKPSRPARGPKIGAMIAMAIDEKSYAIGVSLVNPGVEVAIPKAEKKALGIPRGVVNVVGADVFDKHIAVSVAAGHAVTGEPLPYVVTSTPTTRRATVIRAQFENFRIQAAKVFKDKTEAIVEQKPKMIKTGEVA